MQNTFSQSGNDSKWFLTKFIFQNRYVALETPSRLMANAILNFHFDFPHTSLIAPHIIRPYQIVCHFCQPENYHLLTSRGFGCYLSTSRNITPDFKQKVCDLTLLPWYSRFHVFLFLRCLVFCLCFNV